MILSLSYHDFPPLAPFFAFLSILLIFFLSPLQSNSLFLPPSFLFSPFSFHSTPLFSYSFFTITTPTSSPLLLLLVLLLLHHLLHHSSPYLSSTLLLVHPSLRSSLPPSLLPSFFPFYSLISPLSHSSFTTPLLSSPTLPLLH